MVLHLEKTLKNFNQNVFFFKYKLWSWWPLSMVTWRLPFQQLLHWGVGEGATPLPRVLRFTLHFLMLSSKQGGIKYHFWVFGMTLPGIEPRSRGPLVNTRLIRPMARCFQYSRIRLYLTTFCPIKTDIITVFLNPNETNDQTKNGITYIYIYIYIYIYMHIQCLLNDLDDLSSISGQSCSCFLRAFTLGKSMNTSVPLAGMGKL